MKYLLTLLLFYSNLHQSQNKPDDLTSLEIIHYFGELNFSRCNMNGYPILVSPEYFNNDEQVKYFTKNEKIVKSLYSIYINAKKWRKRKRDLYEDFYGNKNLRNMFIIEYNKFKDTIYTTIDNKELVFKDGEFIYRDDKNEIRNTLGNEINEFLDKNFKDKYDEISKVKIDSINDISKIRINNIPIDKLNKFDFENKIGPYIIINTESILNTETSEYDINSSYFFDFENYIKFENENGTISYLSIKYNTDNIKFSIDNRIIQIGEKSEELKNIFINSFKKVKLENELSNINNGNYTVELKLISNQFSKLFLSYKNNKLFEINFTNVK